MEKPTAASLSVSDFQRSPWARWRRGVDSPGGGVSSRHRGAGASDSSTEGARRDHVGFADRVCVETLRSGSVSLARFAFQACSIDHSDISPFRINNLRSLFERDLRVCDKSSNVPRSLTGFSSIAAPGSGDPGLAGAMTASEQADDRWNQPRRRIHRGATGITKTTETDQGLARSRTRTPSTSSPLLGSPLAT